MIDQLKNATAREWLRALEREGFTRRKTKGSHHVYQHMDGRRVLIVYHKLGETFALNNPPTSGWARWGEGDLQRLKHLK